MPSSYTCLHYHLVFSTKNREPMIHSAWQDQMFAYIGGILRGEEGCLLAAGCMPDHVHLLVGISKRMAVADALRIIKSKSSKWVHETIPACSEFAWQEGYGAFTVSYSSLDAVREYLANQAEHHRVRTFQEEFLAMLERHGIPYDPRYIWE